jgi:hypothetical protein
MDDDGSQKEACGGAVVVTKDENGKLAHGSRGVGQNESIRPMFGFSRSVVQMTVAGREVIRVFPSLQSAAEHNTVAPCHISACCHGRRVTTGGYAWRFATPAEAVKFVRKSPNSKAVVQLSRDGSQYLNSFTTAMAAAKHVEGFPYHINSCCKDKRKSAYGYMWRFEDDYVRAKKERHSFLKKE